MEKIIIYITLFLTIHRRRTGKNNFGSSWSGSWKPVIQLTNVPTTITITMPIVVYQKYDILSR